MAKVLDGQGEWIEKELTSNGLFSASSRLARPAARISYGSPRRKNQISPEGKELRDSTVSCTDVLPKKVNVI